MEMKMPPILGLSGYAGSGKDTLGGLLNRYYGYQRASIAAPVYSLLARMDPFVLPSLSTPERLHHPLSYGWSQAKQIPEVRRLLQQLGHEGRSVLGDDVWIDALFRRRADRPLVICDVRYPNEVDRIRREGGAVFRVFRPGAEPALNHEGETALDGADLRTIHNVSTPDYMLRQVEALLHFSRP